MKPALFALAICTFVWGSIYSLLYVVPAVNAWEKANDYPYGRMCDSIFTGFQNTCR